MRESPRQRSRCCRFLVSGDSPDRDLLQSLKVLRCPAALYPALPYSSPMERATLGSLDDSCKFADTSLSLSLPDIQASEVQGGSWKKSFDPVFLRLVPQNQIKSLPGQTAWCCCRRICPLSRVLSHAGLHRFVGARAHKPRQGYLQHSPPPNVPPTLLPKHFLSRDNDNDGGRGMKAAACSPVSPEFA